MSKPTWEGWQKKYPSMEDQAEFFLLRFGKDDDIKRPDVMKLKDQFKTFAKPGKGELEEDEAMRLLESRDQTKTFKELRQMVVDIDVDKNRKLSFLEWACAIFGKSWERLHAPVLDPEVVAAAEREALRKKEEEEKARREEDEKRVLELQAKAAKAEKEKDVEAQQRAKAELEAELKRQEEETKRRMAEEAAERARKEAEENERRAKELRQQGLAGKVAFFKYAASDVKDPTKENAQKIKEEAAKRKLLKQQEIEALAKKKLAEEEVAKKKAEADAAQKAAEEAERAAALAAKKKAEAEEEARKAEEEKKKAAEKSEAPIREAYERKKKEEEEKERQKKEEEEKKRQVGRQKIAGKAALWSKDSSSQVVNEVKSADITKLNHATTKEKSGLQQASLMGQIRKGTLTLQKTPGKLEKSDELTDDQKAAFVADQMKKRSSVDKN